MAKDRFALLIATNKYEDPDLRQLSAPENDAQNLLEVLKKRNIGNFDVRILLNEPSFAVFEEIERFFSDRERDDLLLLYFSGHGIKSRAGQLYFATVNTNRKLLQSTAVSASRVNEIMQQCRSRQQVLLLDCCYSGAFARGMTVKADKQICTGEYFSQGSGQVVLTASDAIQYAFEGDEIKGEGIHSVFTETLVCGLTTGEADVDLDGIVSFNDLYSYTYRNVKNRVPEQEPRKWEFNVKGDIIIASNPHPIAKPLPSELETAIRNPFADVRVGAVHTLEKLLNDKDRGLKLAAKRALEELSDDDSRRVSTLADETLKSHDPSRKVKKSERKKKPPEKRQKESRLSGLERTKSKEESMSRASDTKSRATTRERTESLEQQTHSEVETVQGETHTVRSDEHVRKIYCYHPEHLQQIVSSFRTIRKFTVSLGRKKFLEFELPELDWQGLIEEGLVECCFSQLLTDPDDLLKFGKYDQLKQVLEYYYNNWTTENPDEEDWFWQGLCLKFLKDDSSGAIECLTKVTEYKQNLMAYVWFRVFSNSEKARSCLKRAEGKAYCSHDWLSCAEGWKEIFNNEQEARRCLEMAERKASRSHEGLGCAKHWRWLLNNNHEARRCLELVESKAYDSHDWLSCAEGWKEIFNNEREARRCLKIAEGKAGEPFGWMMCSQTWKEKMNDEYAAQQCLEVAESDAEEFFDWLYCAEYWKNVLNNEHEARRCLKAAVDRTEVTDDWNYCAEYWKRLFNNNREARRCLKMAESKTDNFSLYWKDCARGWKQIFNNEKEARRCLEMAESEAGDNSYYWHSLAKSWKYLLNNEQEARRCLMTAEDKADDSQNLAFCAEDWMEIFNNERKARRCLKAAEDKASKSNDLARCAETWKKILGDESEARRCLEMAKSKPWLSTD